MRLNQQHPLNFNGYINPIYLAHLEPLMKDRAVSIGDADIPAADPFVWARRGILSNFNTQGGTTTKEALVIKGEGSRLVDYINQLGTDGTCYSWVKDYYLGSPEDSVETLMAAIGNKSIMKEQAKLIGAMLIQDFGFDDSNELSAFMLNRLHPVHHPSIQEELDTLLLHYISDEDQIWEYELKADNAYEHVTCAKLWAKIGCQEKARKHLELAQCTAGQTFFAWRDISINYLRLLADFDMAEEARIGQIASCFNMGCVCQVAIDLAFYLGTEKAIEEGCSFMSRAADHVGDGNDYNDLADVWREVFENEERAHECEELGLNHDRKSNEAD